MQPEGDADLLPGRQRQVVDLVLQRDDPAVEQIGGIDALAAEVIEEEEPVIGLHVRRGFVEAQRGAVGQVELGHRHLAAGGDERALDPQPALVDTVRLGDLGREVVKVGVIDANDVALDGDAVGDPKIALKHLVQEPAKRGFAVTRRAEQEQASAG